MRKLLLLLIFGLIPSLAGLAPGKRVQYIPAGVKIEPFKALWQATCIVESSNNPLAYNAQEQATGIAQIRPIRLQDYNKRTHKGYKLKDCYDPKISKEIWLYYANKIGFRNYEQIARQWNGKGYKTTIYWNKIKKQLLTIKN